MIEKLCECGCGQQTKISQVTDQPNRFIHGHHARGIGNPNYKGGKPFFTPNEGVMVRFPSLPRGYISEHVLICSQILGKPLPAKAVIHHWDRDNSNNRNTNLLMCDNQNFHNFIHMRMRAYEACGHAKYKRCNSCNQWLPPDEMVKNSYEVNGIGHQCKICHREQERERRRRKKYEAH